MKSVAYPYLSLFVYHFSLFAIVFKRVNQFIWVALFFCINLASLSDEIMASLDEFGTLKAALVAMKMSEIRNF
jgi:hypothetical protein